MMKKRIFIDGYFLKQKVTGVQRFAEELVKSLQNYGYEVTILAPKDILRGIEGVEVKKHQFFKGLLWQQFYLPLFLIIHGSPLIASFSGLGPLLYSKKIITIHDGSLYRYPEFFSLSYRVFYKILYPVTIFFSLGIITVSDFSRCEIKRFIIKNKKIHIVNNIVSKIDAYDVEKGSICDYKYILTVGSLDKRKNLKNILEGFNQSNIKDKYKLVVVGGQSAVFKDSIYTKDTLENVVFLGYVSDDDLSSLYSNAAFFIYLPLYEGFGIPPLEALSFNCPVLLSDIHVFHEIYGKDFIYTDPLDTKKIQESIDEFALMDMEKVLLQQREILSKYNSNKQASQFDDIYNEVNL